MNASLENPSMHVLSPLGGLDDRQPSIIELSPGISVGAYVLGTDDDGFSLTDGADVGRLQQKPETGMGLSSEDFSPFEVGLALMVSAEGISCLPSRPASPVLIDASPELS